MPHNATITTRCIDCRTEVAQLFYRTSELAVYTSNSTTRPARRSDASHGLHSWVGRVRFCIQGARSSNSATISKAFACRRSSTSSLSSLGLSYTCQLWIWSLILTAAALVAKTGRCRLMRGCRECRRRDGGCRRDGSRGECVMRGTKCRSTHEEILLGI